MDSQVLDFLDAGISRNKKWLLKNINWQVKEGERWVILGPNGSGKTTLMALATGFLFPTEGEVRLFEKPLGSFNLRRARSKIGYLSAVLADKLPPNLTGLEVVMTARYGALRPEWHSYSQADRKKAVDLLKSVGCAILENQEYFKCSSGEKQRLALARTLMADPLLVLLDEPAAGLDLGGREELLMSLSELDPQTTCVLVTHHTEEIPPNFENILLLREGQIVAKGKIQDALTPQNLSACFGGSFQISRTQEGRYFTQSLS